MVLPPEGMPWGRWAQAEIERLRTDSDRRAQGELNTNLQQNATINLLSKTVAGLEDTVTDLTETQATLGDTVIRLDGVVTDLGDVVTLLVTPAWTKNTITGFAVPQPINGGVTVSASMIVPANAKDCSLIIIADAFVNGLSSGEGDANIFLSITDPITSVAYSMAHIPENDFSSVQTFAVGGINNLTPGTTMTFSALLRTGTTAGLAANVNNYLTVSTMATFQR